MLLTRIWAVILAVLATGCLAGMFLLSAGNSGDFSEADRDAVRAVTEAGVAALSAGIHSSEVQQISGLVLNDRLREAATRDDAGNEPEDFDGLPLEQVLSEASEDLRVRTSSDVTVAVVDGKGNVLAANGIAEGQVANVVTSDDYRAVPPNEEAVFSATVGDDIHVIKVTKTIAKDRRLVGIEQLDVGAGSLLRRVLGSETPAGLVRGGSMVGDIIGDQPIADEIEQLADEHAADIPDQGASAVFALGTGLDKRIGAIGRVPGPAGQGPNGALLVVMSRQTAAAGQQDVAAAISDARRRGVRVNWPILIGLLLLSAALAIYLPELEGIGPLRRLTGEFNALAVGQQHQIFHDRYSGAAGGAARAAAQAYEALRQAFLAELEIDDDGIEEEEPESRRQRPRTSRHRRLTRAHQKLQDGAAESAAAPAPVAATPSRRRRPSEPAAQVAAEPEPAAAQPTVADAPVPTAPAPEPDAAPTPAPAPTPDPAPAPAPPPAAAPAPPAAPAAAPAPAPAPPAEDDTEFAEIFEEFVQVKQACGEPTENLTYPRFAAKLRKNERDLKKKRPEIKRVQFSVYVKDGKAALKAKVVK